jgi:ABC-type lipoprotein export system ATPase subunit
VAYARALINKPNIILMDEPDNGLYSQMDHEILRFLMRLVREENKTLIIATNDSEFITNADRFIKLRKGTVIENRITSKKK